MKDSLATFLQIDLQSLFGTYNRKRKLDFEKIMEHFNSRETEFLTGACIYTIKSSDFDASRFETKLKIIGFDVKAKSLKTSKNSYAPTISHIVPITIDSVFRSYRYDKLILMSNNTKGLYDLCKFLKDLGKKIELWCFNHNYDPVLETLVDRHFIEDNFCMSTTSNSLSVFGANNGPYFEHEMDSTTFKTYA
jgi:hypothetical protein